MDRHGACHPVDRLPVGGSDMAAAAATMMSSTATDPCDHSQPTPASPPTVRSLTARPPSTRSLVDRIRNCTRIPRPVYATSRVVSMNRDSQHSSLKTKRAAASSFASLPTIDRSLQHSATRFTSGRDRRRQASDIDDDVQLGVASTSSVSTVHDKKRAISQPAIGSRPVCLIADIVATCRIPRPTSDVLSVRSRTSSTSTVSSLDRNRRFKSKGTLRPLHSCHFRTPVDETKVGRIDTSRHTAVNSYIPLAVTASVSSECSTTPVRTGESTASQSLESGSSQSIACDRCLHEVNGTEHSDLLSGFSRFHRRRLVTDCNHVIGYDVPSTSQRSHDRAPRGGSGCPVVEKVRSGIDQCSQSSERTFKVAAATTLRTLCQPSSSSSRSLTTSVSNTVSDRPRAQSTSSITRNYELLKPLGDVSVRRSCLRRDSSECTTATILSTTTIVSSAYGYLNENCDADRRSTVTIESRMTGTPRVELLPELREFLRCREATSLLIAESSATDLLSSSTNSQLSISIPPTVKTSSLSLTKTSRTRRRRPTSLVRIPPIVADGGRRDGTSGEEPNVAQLMKVERHAIVVLEFRTVVDAVDEVQDDMVDRKRCMTAAVSSTVGAHSPDIVSGRELHVIDDVIDVDRLGIETLTLTRTTSSETGSHWTKADNALLSVASDIDAFERFEFEDDVPAQCSINDGDVTVQHSEDRVVKVHGLAGQQSVTENVTENDTTQSYSMTGNETESDIVTRQDSVTDSDVMKRHGVTGQRSVVDNDVTESSSLIENEADCDVAREIFGDVTEYRGVTDDDVIMPCSVSEYDAASTHNSATFRQPCQCSNAMLMTSSVAVSHVDVAISDSSANDDSAEELLLIVTSYGQDRELPPTADAARADLIEYPVDSALSPHTRLTVREKVVVVEPLNYRHEDDMSITSYDLSRSKSLPPGSSNNADVIHNRACELPSYRSVGKMPHLPYNDVIGDVEYTTEEYAVIGVVQLGCTPPVLPPELGQSELKVPNVSALPEVELGRRSDMVALSPVVPRISEHVVTRRVETRLYRIPFQTSRPAALGYPEQDSVNRRRTVAMRHRTTSEGDRKPSKKASEVPQRAASCGTPMIAEEFTHSKSSDFRGCPSSNRPRVIAADKRRTNLVLTTSSSVGRHVMPYRSRNNSLSEQMKSDSLTGDSDRASFQTGEVRLETSAREECESGAKSGAVVGADLFGDTRPCPIDNDHSCDRRDVVEPVTGQSNRVGTKDGTSRQGIRSSDFEDNRPISINRTSLGRSEADRQRNDNQVTHRSDRWDTKKEDSDRVTLRNDCPDTQRVDSDQFERENPHQYHFVTTSGQQTPIIFRFRRFVELDRRKCIHSREPSTASASVSKLRSTTRHVDNQQTGNTKQVRCSSLTSGESSNTTTMRISHRPPTAGRSTTCRQGDRSRPQSNRVEEPVRVQVEENVFLRPVDATELCCHHVAPPPSSVTVVELLHEAAVVRDHLVVDDRYTATQRVEALLASRPRDAIAVRSVERLDVAVVTTGRLRPPSADLERSEDTMSVAQRDIFREVHAQSSDKSAERRDVRRRSTSFPIELDQRSNMKKIIESEETLHSKTHTSSLETCYESTTLTKRVSIGNLDDRKYSPTSTTAAKSRRKTESCSRRRHSSISPGNDDSTMTQSLDVRACSPSDSRHISQATTTSPDSSVQFVTLSGRTTSLVFQFTPTKVRGVSIPKYDRATRVRKATNGDVIKTKTSRKSHRKSRMASKIDESTGNEDVQVSGNEVEASTTVSLLCLPSSNHSSLIDELEPVESTQPIEPLRQHQQTVCLEPLQAEQPTIVVSTTTIDCAVAPSDRRIRQRRRLEQSDANAFFADGSFRLQPMLPTTKPIKTALMVALKPVRLSKARRLRHRSTSTNSAVVARASLRHAALVVNNIDSLRPEPSVEVLPPCPMKLLHRSAFVDEQQFACVVDDTPRRRRQLPKVPQGSTMDDTTWLATYRTMVDKIRRLRPQRVREIRPVRQAAIIDDVQLMENGMVDTLPPAVVVSTSVVCKSAALVAERNLRPTTPSPRHCQHSGRAASGFVERCTAMSAGSGTDRRTTIADIISGNDRNLFAVPTEHKEQQMRTTTSGCFANEPQVMATDSSSSVDPPNMASSFTTYIRRSVSVQTDTYVRPTRSSTDSLPYVEPMELFEALDIDTSAMKNPMEFLPLDDVKDGGVRLTKCHCCSTTLLAAGNSVRQDSAGNFDTELLASSESRESLHLAPMFRCPVDVAATTATVCSANQPMGVLEVDNDPDLAKFIPIRFPVPSLMPIISHNSIDRSEWFRAQLALDATRNHTDTSGIDRMSRSHSDSSLYKTIESENRRDPDNDENYRADDRDPLNWLAALPEVDGVYQSSRHAARSSHSTDGQATAMRHQRKPLAEATYPDVDDSRFDETNNSEYCRVNVGLSICRPADDGLMDATSTGQSPVAAEVWAELYVEMPRGRQVNVTLYHVKVDLACTALRAYLDPCCQVQFSYIRSIRDKLIQLAQCDLVKPKFARFVCSDQFDCILVVSRDAGVLLRHENLGLLHTLAAVFELNSADRVLIMVSR